MDIGQTEGLCQIHGRVGARIGRFCQCRGREQREHEHQDEKCGQNSFHRVTSIFSNIRAGEPRRFGRVKKAYHIFRKNARKCCKFAECFFEFYIVFTKYNGKLPDLSLRGGQGPTWRSRQGGCQNGQGHRRPCVLTDDCSGAQRAPWAAAGFAALCRPHTPCRGAACRSRQCTPDSYWLPLKWYTPIASVAALSERLVHLQIMQRKFIGMRLPSLSLRGPEGAVAISQYPAGSQEGRGENATACPRLPRRPLASSQ